VNLNKCIGSIVGVAIGDCLGAPVEFLQRGKFNVTALKEDACYTDDTAMTLCLADSLIRCKENNIYDQLETYLKWLENGYMSCDGRVRGIGQTVLRSLVYYKKHKKIFTKNKNRLGNGGLMRIAPIAVFYRDDLYKAIKEAAISTYVTHSAKICLDVSMLYVGLIVGAINGINKDELLSKDYINELLKIDYKFEIEVLDIFLGSYKEKSKDKIISSGFVLHTLESALWSFYNSDSFKESVITAVNLGGDADTIGAVCGMLSGAYYGYDNLHKDLRKIKNFDTILDIAKLLFHISKKE